MVSCEYFRLPGSDATAAKKNPPFVFRSVISEQPVQRKGLCLQLPGFRTHGSADAGRFFSGGCERICVTELASTKISHSENVDWERNSAGKDSFEHTEQNLP